MPRLDEVVEDMLCWIEEHPDEPRHVRKAMMVHMIQQGLGATLGRILADLLTREEGR